MVQWSDPNFEAHLAEVDTNVSFLLLGLYGWEYLSSLDVEYATLRRRLTFRWPLVPYVVGRVFTFFFVLLLVIRSNPPSPTFFCLPTAMVAAFTGDIGLGCTSINLMIRTWLIWRDSRVVRMALVLFVIGHWVILALDVANLQGGRTENGCFIKIAHEALNGVVFIYSLFFDFLVLVLAVVGLSRQATESPLSKRLRSQGLVYFAVAVVMYIPPTVFAIIGNVYLINITGLAALCASNIASCRAVRSLLDVRPVKSSEVTEDSTGNEFALTSQIPLQTVNAVPVPA